MGKLLFIILTSISVSTDVLYGGNLCNDYNDKSCVHPNAIKNGYYLNQWSVHLPGMTMNQAKQLLEDNGFDYLGQVTDGVDLHLVTKKGTIVKHVLPDAKTIKILENLKQVDSVAQKHIFENSQNEMVSINYEKKVTIQPLYPNMIVLNDGKENLERIKTNEMYMTSYSRPTSNTDESSDTESSDTESSNTESPNENLSNSPNKKLTIEDLFNLPTFSE